MITQRKVSLGLLCQIHLPVTVSKATILVPVHLLCWLLKYWQKISSACKRAGTSAADHGAEAETISSEGAVHSSGTVALSSSAHYTATVCLHIVFHIIFVYESPSPQLMCVLH